jgi:DNA-binding NtrC family response regulator
VGNEREGATLSAWDNDGGADQRCPYLFRIVECHRPAAPPARHALAGLDEVIFERGGRGHALAQRQMILTSDDGWMSSTHARLSRRAGRWVLEDAGSKNGTFVNGAAGERFELIPGDVLELGRTFFLYDEDLAVPASAAHVEEKSGAGTIYPGLERSFARLAQIAGSMVSVVVLGESGTGKELVARTVHARSRRAGDFVAVNCGALAPNLVESELFGYRKGAFSGATEDRPGLVRAAHRGTLFLDEIGDLPEAAQASLLRVLQEREVLPVGGTKPVPVDLRVVSATHRDLERLTATGKFRRDLAMRLSGFMLVVPSLRDRLADLGAIAAELLERSGGLVGFHAKAMRALLAHGWPGNIRELEKVLAAASVLAGNGPIGLDHLPASITTTGPGLPELRAADAERRDQLVALLRQHAGNVAAVARELGKARNQIQRWIKRYQIQPGEFA